MRKIIFTSLTLALMLAMGACSPKGSSSLNGSRTSSSTSKSTPRVRTSSTETTAQRNARIEAERKAEAAAAAQAQQAAQNANDIAERETAKAKTAAKNAQADAEKATAKAKTAAQKRDKERELEAQEAAAKAVVREEKVKVLEGQLKEQTDGMEDSGAQFHIIIGSFKVLANARQVCQDAIKNKFLPSIMENEDGLYRVAIYSTTTEATAREKIADLRKKFPEYEGIWVLKEKR